VIWMRFSERMKAGKQFNKWRERIQKKTGVFPSYCVENMLVWLETDGQYLLKKLKPQRKRFSGILGYRNRRLQY
jgi:hypothetical protein